MQEQIQDKEFDDIIPKSELQIFSLNQLSIPLGEYMREVMIVSRQCGIRFEMKDNGDRYRFDFDLHEFLFWWEKSVFSKL